LRLNILLSKVSAKREISEVFEERFCNTFFAANLTFRKWAEWVRKRLLGSLFEPQASEKSADIIDLLYAACNLIY